MSNKTFRQTASRPAETPEEAWKLFCAAADGDLDQIRQLIVAAPELIHHQIWYEFPIHFAVRAGEADAVKILLEAGSNPAFSNFTYSSWQKLLPMAAERRHHDMRDLLEAEMKRRFDYDPDYVGLWNAISNGDLNEVLSLVESDPKLVRIGDCHGNRALHWAVLARRLPVIDALLDAGADIQALRADYQSPLHLSVADDYWFCKTDGRNPDTSQSEVTDRLLERGAPYEFSVAAARGDLKRLHQLLSSDPALASHLNDSRRSSLRHAAAYGHLEVVRVLLDHGADPNLPEVCATRGGALFDACGRQDLVMVKLLLEHGADPNAEVDSSGNCLSIADHGQSDLTSKLQTLLREHGAQDGLWAVKTCDQIRDRLRQGDVTVIQPIIAEDQVTMVEEFVGRFGTQPIVNLEPARGWNTPRSKAMLEALMHHGMNVNRRDWFAQTHLHCCSDDVDRIGWLIEHGIDINAVDFYHGTTAIGVAAKNGNSDVVKFLLEKGADPQVPIEHEWAQPRVLAEAAENRDVELVIRTHLVLGALTKDPRSILTPDSNILHSAVHYAEEEIAWALLEAGADIEAEHPQQGGKPLHWATEGNVKIMRWLIDRGADVNSRVVSDNERNGMTPLIYCAWWCGDCDDCIANAMLLIDLGADLKARDAEGKSAVERARQQGHDRLANALKVRGCS